MLADVGPDPLESHNPAAMARILIVEDEDKIRSALARGLAEEGHDVAEAADGDAGLALALAEPTPDCLVLDLMLPGLDGLDVLRGIRRAGLSTPVLMLSARSEVEDRVNGLDAGADDYLAKPFAWAELLARVRACLRRRASEPATLLKAGSVELDPARRRASREGREVELTIRECELLEALIRKAGGVVSRDELARDVWRDPSAGLTNVIDVYINYLRKKLDKVGAKGVIQAVRGVGYCLRADGRGEP